MLGSLNSAALSPPACLPAAGEPFELHGLILRSTLLHLLRTKRGFMHAPQPGGTLLDQQQSGGGGGKGPGRAVLNRGASRHLSAAAVVAAQQLECVPPLGGGRQQVCVCVVGELLSPQIQ